MVNHSSMQAQIAELREQGYVVVPRFVPDIELAGLNHAARRQLAARSAPLEFEADLSYPGAPASRTAAGGETVRRLLDAYSRDAVFARQGMDGSVRDWMQLCFGERVLMSRAHHNCVMTKHPRYGSLTGWHRDIRYWSFPREDLISVWLALGVEEIDNGALWFVPGSHRMAFDAGRFDAARFFRPDRADNAAILQTMQSPRLAPGDAVFFHSNTLHSAGRNQSGEVKYSLVFTYHAAGNPPCAGSRSASMPEMSLD